MDGFTHVRDTSEPMPAADQAGPTIGWPCETAIRSMDGERRPFRITLVKVDCLSPDISPKRWRQTIAIHSHLSAYPTRMRSFGVERIQ